MIKNFFLLLTVIGIIFCVSCKKESGTALPVTGGEYVVFAWNDLGMHCLNPTYDEMVILPPYNTVNAQVLKRGNPPQVITTGLTVEYNLINNTSSFGKRAYGGFWTNFTALFGGPPPANNIGLTGTALFGTMTAKTDDFTAEGMPVVPVTDAGVWDPFQVIEVKVNDATVTLWRLPRQLFLLRTK